MRWAIPLQIGPDHILRWCVPIYETKKILTKCHEASYGGHFDGQRTTLKILQCGYFWPTLYKDERNYVVKCDRCQRTKNISKKNDMSLSSILDVELFNVRNIDFMGPFPTSKSCQYILIVVDYVPKWVEVIAFAQNGAMTISKFLKKNIFNRFRTPCALISDEGMHLINHIVDKLLMKFHVNHKVATTYPIQTNGQADISNHEIKIILPKVFNVSCND